MGGPWLIAMKWWVLKLDEFFSLKDGKDFSVDLFDKGSITEIAVLGRGFAVYRMTIAECIMLRDALEYHIRNKIGADYLPFEIHDGDLIYYAGTCRGSFHQHFIGPDEKTWTFELTVHGRDAVQSGDVMTSRQWFHHFCHVAGGPRGFSLHRAIAPGKFKQVYPPVMEGETNA